VSQATTVISGEVPAFWSGDGSSRQGAMDPLKEALFFEKMPDKIPQNKFRAVVSGFLFVIGAKLILFP
jgi:hypothetical protein